MGVQLKISNCIKAKYYAFVMSNARYDKYVNGQNNYVVENIFLKPLRDSSVVSAITDTDLYFHEKCILILNNIWYDIDEPCMIPITRGTVYQVRNLHWFRRMLFTAVHKKKQS